MPSTRTIHGLEIRLRPRGAGRLFSAAFLAFWLCGWAAGETFAIWALVKGAIALLTGTPAEPGSGPPEVVPALGVALFLIVWLAFWTFGGIMAMRELLRLTWAEDLLIVHGGQLRVRQSTGPFRKTHEFGREGMRRFGLSHRRDVLTLWTTTGNLELSSLGTPEERREAADLLRSELGVAEAMDEAELPILPDGWEETLTPEGERALVPSTKRRAMQARVASVITLMLLGIAVVIARESPASAQALPFAIVVFTVAALIAWGAVWLARGRMEWVIGSGRITLRRRFGGSLKALFEARALEISVSKDGDGDEWFQLDAVGKAEEPTRAGVVTAQDTRRKILSTMHDPEDPRRLGAWLARATGVPLGDRSTAERSQADVAAMLAQLEQSGRLGKWLAGWAGRAVERKPQ